jgi:tetratricopeptide (TPR) repeat protein
MLGCAGMRTPRQMYSAFLGAHRRAVALAGLTPELRSDRGYGLHMFERRMVEAEPELLRAHREQPSLAPTCVRLVMLYTALGRFDDALRMLEQGYRADSLFPMLPATEISVRFCRRDFAGAVACGAKAVELHPYVQLARVFYAQALEYAGHLDEALAQYRNACVICPDLPWLRTLEGACLAKIGRHQEGLAVLHDLEKIRETEYVDAYYMAILQDALGSRERALTELTRAYQEGSTALPILDVDPKMDRLRADPRLRTVQELSA